MYINMNLVWNAYLKLASFLIDRGKGGLREILRRDGPAAGHAPGGQGAATQQQQRAQGTSGQHQHQPQVFHRPSTTGLSRPWAYVNR